jgi:hypothetical protein
MMSIEDRILKLDDKAAAQLLMGFGSSHTNLDVPTGLDDQLTNQLRKSLDVGAEQMAQNSTGDLARAALLVLAHDPARREELAMIIASGPAQKFVVVEAAVVISAVLIVLQTHVNFERDKRGKWSVKVEKKATDATLLRELVKKLLAFSG